MAGCKIRGRIWHDFRRCHCLCSAGFVGTAASQHIAHRLHTLVRRHSQTSASARGRLEGPKRGASDCKHSGQARLQSAHFTSLWPVALTDQKQNTSCGTKLMFIRAVDIAQCCSSTSQSLLLAAAVCGRPQLRRKAAQLCQLRAGGAQLAFELLLRHPGPGAGLRHARRRSRLGRRR